MKYVFLFLTASLAWAQVAGTISGTVEDASGAPVGGATVTVRSLETGARRVANTGPAGNFTVPSLALGQQELKVERTGFKALVRTGINLTVGQEAEVNLRLEVGDIVQQVTVVADAFVVNTTTAPVSGLVGEREVKDLPLNGRSFDNLITLNPGTINYSAMKSQQTNTGAANTFSVAGRRTSENLFLLNGIEYTGSSQLNITPGGVSGDLLGIDAIREFNVLTDTYSAEYGKRPGAQVSVVTQSGTNALHGSLFEFLRNSALDARNPLSTLSFVPPFRQNQFGGALGGPLKKDRLFLFGNYEGFRQSLALNSVSVVPDAQARQGFLPNASGVYSKVANLNVAMLLYASSFWPEPNGAELLSNGVASGTALSFNTPRQSIREDFGTQRTDYFLRDQDSLSAAYTIDDGRSVIPLADPLFGSSTTLRMQVASLQETHIVSPQMLNTFRAGYSRAGFTLDPALFAAFSPSLSFVTGAGPGLLGVTGGTTGAGPANQVWNRRNLFTLTDGFQIARGIHQISFGGWFQRIHDNEDTVSRRAGQATFASLTTFLQGTVQTFQVAPHATELGWRSLFGAWYIQDTIKLRPNFTLSLGLRHEFTTGWNETYGRAANYVLDSSGILATEPRVGNSIYTENNARKLFGPRISLAWDPFRNGKTAIRSGFGIYYGLIDDLAFLLNGLPPFNGSLTYSNVALSSITPIIPGTPVQPSCGPGVTAACTTYAPQGIQADAKTPTVVEWNFTVEQQLSHNTALRVGYVGSHGYHGLLNIDPNTIPAQICASAGGCASGGIATAAAAKGAVPQGAQYIPLGGRPNPNVSAAFLWYTEGNSSYNALQTEVVHRFSRGLQFRANYTWSKNLDMNSALTGAQANNQSQMVMDRNDPRRDWGPSALNVTGQSNISARYELPFGKGRRWLNGASGWGGKLIDGWQLNGIGTFLTGFPFTPVAGSNRSGDGNTRNPDRPSLNPAFAGPIVLGKPSQWFDPNAFILPTPGTFGNSGRGILKGPGLSNVNVSVFKNTALRETASLEFRAEFFNVLNHANFGPPSPTVFSSGAISASAGLITTTTTTPRQIQFGLKLIF